MTQYWTDFSDQVIGDWTDRWEAQDTLEIATTGLPTGATGGACLKMYDPSNNEHLASWDVIDSDANRDNVEMIARFQFDTQRAYGFMLWARASGAAGTETAYAAVARSIYGHLTFAEWAAGARTLNSSDTGHTMSINTWYWMRARFNGSNVTLKFWADGASEPGTWDLSTTDSTITAAGWVGVGYGDQVTVHVDVFGVGTNGDTAPTTAPATDERRGGVHFMQEINHIDPRRLGIR